MTTRSLKQTLFTRCALPAADYLWHTALPSSLVYSLTESQGVDKCSGSWLPVFVICACTSSCTSLLQLFGRVSGACADDLTDDVLCTLYAHMMTDDCRTVSFHGGALAAYVCNAFLNSCATVHARQCMAQFRELQLLRPFFFNNNNNNYHFVFVEPAGARRRLGSRRAYDFEGRFRFSACTSHTRLAATACMWIWRRRLVRAAMLPSGVCPGPALACGRFSKGVRAPRAGKQHVPVRRAASTH